MDDGIGVFFLGMFMMLVIVAIALFSSASETNARIICSAAGYTSESYVDGDWYCIKAGDGASVISLDELKEQMEALNE